MPRSWTRVYYFVYVLSYYDMCPHATMHLSAYYLTGNAEELDPNRVMRPPPVVIHKLEGMASMAGWNRQLRDFPGPLTNNSGRHTAMLGHALHTHTHTHTHKQT
jgi:hypothetical protein